MKSVLPISSMLLSGFFLVACSPKPSADTVTKANTAPVASDKATTIKNEPIQPIEVTAAAEPAKVALGQSLFFDPRLSKSGAISCNSCHNLATSGTDNLKTSIGDHWQQGPINSPTVLNARYNIAQFWNGRAKDLKEQAGGPVANPGEMASTHEVAVQVLNSIPAYKDTFKAAYGVETISIDNVTDAIAKFEETLVTPNARFDKWLKGDEQALNDTEKQGYELFKASGCIACHTGVAVGGGSFQKLGVYKPYSTKNKSLGRFDVTKVEADKNLFKVPTLRNVELTYPYFHDGEVKTLTQAVDLMGQLQVNKTFTADENAKIVAFLKSLTGELPKITLPALPPSNETTPAPQPF